MSSFNLHYSKRRKSNSDVWEHDEDSPLTRTKGHFLESDYPVDTEHRCPYQCHMKNTLKTFHLWYLCSVTGRAKGSADGFGVFLSFCVMILLTRHPEFFVSFVSEEEKLLVPSIWSQSWCYLIWEQLCFISFCPCLLLPATSFFSKHFKTRRARWRIRIKVIASLTAA